MLLCLPNSSSHLQKDSLTVRQMRVDPVSLPGKIIFHVIDIIVCTKDSMNIYECICHLYFHYCFCKINCFQVSGI